MIKKLLLTFSFIALITIAFSGTTYAAQEGEKIVISEELTKLNDLYKEGIITEEEFSKAKSILLNPNQSKKRRKKKRVLTDFIEGGKGTTAAERKRLKEAEEEELKALKKQLREEKRAERDRIAEEKIRVAEERRKVCTIDPKSEACKKAKLKLTYIYDKLKTLGSEMTEKTKSDREEAKQALREKKQADAERKERIKAEAELKRQASLEEKKRIKAEKAARIAERKRLKAEWKKACSEDSESKTCKEGKPSEKIKNVLKKIEKKLGG